MGVILILVLLLFVLWVFQYLDFVMVHSLCSMYLVEQ